MNQNQKHENSKLSQHERSVIILLAGGDKSTQARDIKTALRLARNL